MKLPHTLLTLAVVTLLISGCGDDSNPFDSEDDPKTGSGSPSGGLASGASSLSDLGLSGALNVELPASVEAEGSSSLALASTKSREACEIRRTIKETMRAIGSVANMFCHFEVEDDKIEFGVKTNIEFSAGDGSFQLWIDDSQDGALKIYFCEDNKLQEKIVVEDADGGKARGYTISHGSEEDGTWGRSAEFDTLSETDEATVEVKDSWSSSSGEAFRRYVNLQLRYDEDGISQIEVAENGTWGGDSFENRGAALIGSAYAMAVYNGKGSDPEGNPFEYTHKAFFNAAGLNVAPDASAEFSSGGDLAVASDSLPAFLSKASEPEKFSDADWDCGGIERTVTLDPESEDHQACDAGDDFSEEDCWDSAYAEGNDI